MIAVGAASLVAVVLAALALIVVRRSRALRRRQRSVLAPVAAPRPRVLVPPRLLAAVLSGPAWRSVLLALGAGGSVGFALGGAVAAVAAGVYAVVGVAQVRRHRAATADRAARSALLDRLTGLTADLRAGVPIRSAAQDPMLADEEGLGALARSAVTLAERTGAPLADLIDRIEADARAGDRARASAIAQAAGAQATALLLAALPVGGLALGYAIGADPLAMLLHTPLGAICACTAITLQVLGLLWSQRLQPRLP
jgi:tight adherence protein B